jgi:hypothetical protein
MYKKGCFESIETITVIFCGSLSAKLKIQMR